MCEVSYTFHDLDGVGPARLHEGLHQLRPVLGQHPPTLHGFYFTLYNFDYSLAIQEVFCCTFIALGVLVFCFVIVCTMWMDVSLSWNSNWLRRYYKTQNSTLCILIGILSAKRFAPYCLKQ